MVDCVEDYILGPNKSNLVNVGDTMQSFDVRLPARRVADLVTTEAGSDLIVYDQNSAAIHTLNDVTVTVWRALESSKSLSDVVTETGLTEDVVRAAATKLADAGLLESNVMSEARASRSRRDFMKKAGAVAALPVIVSVSAPMAASAASCDRPCQPATLACLTGGGSCYVCIPTGLFSGYCGFPIGARSATASTPDAGWVQAEEQRLLDEWKEANGVTD